VTPLIEASGEPRTQDRAGDGGRRADAEKCPVDTTGQVAEQAGDAETEPDGGVRPDGPERICPDETKERRESQRAEDEPDESAQQPDHRSGHDDRTRTCRFLARRPSRGSFRTKQVDPEDEEGHADRDQQRIGRHLGGDQAADHCSRHRWRRHPGEESPIDAACADVGHGSGEGGEG